MKGLLPSYCRILGYAFLLLSVFVPSLMYMFGLIRTDDAFILMKLIAKLVIWISLFVIFLSKTTDEDNITAELRLKALSFSLYVLGVYYSVSLILSIIDGSATTNDSSLSIFYLIMVIISFEFLQKKRMIEKVRNYKKR